MSNFLIVLTSVAVILAYLFCGFFTVKAGKATTSHAKSLSGLLMYVCGPAMMISSFLSVEFTVETLKSIGIFFVATLVLQLTYFLTLYFIFRKKYENAKYRILTVGSFMGNVGFFGMPLVTALFPDKPIVACFSCANMLSMNILVYTVGSYLITNDKKYVSVKNIFFNPTSIALYVALPFYFTNCPIPSPILDAITLLGKMTTPLCMIVLGMRLAAIKPKSLVTEPFAFLSCFLKLVVYPLFCFLAVKFLPFLDDVTKTCIVVLASTPSAAFILTLAELHESEREMSADVVLLSTVLSVVTIPLLLLIL